MKRHDRHTARRAILFPMENVPLTYWELAVDIDEKV